MLLLSAGYWDGSPIGMFYVEVPGDQPKVPIEFTAYGDESDPGPNADGDRHAIVVDRANGKLYELYREQLEGTKGLGLRSNAHGEHRHTR